MNEIKVIDLAAYVTDGEFLLENVTLENCKVMNLHCDNIVYENCKVFLFRFTAGIRCVW